MKTHFVLARLTAMVVIVGTLAACGQRGPLYMPDSPPATKKKVPSTQKTAPAPTIVPEPAKPDASATDRP